MHRARATTRTAPLVACLVAAAAVVSGCNTAKPAPQFTSHMTLVVPASAPTALEALRREAQSLGGAITAETADSFTADYGVQSRRIPVPTEYGLWGSRVVFRETEVHSVTTYSARKSPEGTLVSVSQNPIYWHPDYKVWLPGPHDSVPGMDALRDLSGSR